MNQNDVSVPPAESSGRISRKRRFYHESEHIDKTPTRRRPRVAERWKPKKKKKKQTTKGVPSRFVSPEGKDLIRSSIERRDEPCISATKAPRASDLEAVQRGAACIAEQSCGDPVLIAAVCDTCFEIGEVRSASMHARKRAKHVADQKSQKPSRNKIISSYVQRMGTAKKERAFVSVFCETGTSLKLLKRMNMRDSHESVAQAQARQTQGTRVRKYFPRLFDDSNAAVLANLQARVIEELDCLCENWKKLTEKEFDGRLKHVSTGFSVLGIDGTQDRIFDDIRLAHGEALKVDRSRRSQAIKEIMMSCPTDDVPESFWNSGTVVRRALKPGLHKGIGDCVHEATMQHVFIENHPSDEVEVDGQRFFCGSLLDATNPTSSFDGEAVYAVDVIKRLLAQLKCLFDKGLFNPKKRTDLASLSRVELIGMLKDAGFPESKMGFLPDDINELRDFIYWEFNTLRLKNYGDGSALVKSWPIEIWSIGIIFLAWQWNLRTWEDAEYVRGQILAVHIDQFDRCHPTGADTTKTLALFMDQFTRQPGCDIMHSSIETGNLFLILPRSIFLMFL